MMPRRLGAKKSSGTVATSAGNTAGEATLAADATVDSGRWALSFRVPQQLREAMEKAAAENGRSLSAEAEFRLLMSFRDQNALRQAMLMLCGPELAEIGWEIIDTMRWVAHNRFALLMVKPDVKDPWLYDQIVAGVRLVAEEHPELGEAADQILHVMEQHRPPGEITQPPEAGFHISPRATQQQQGIAERIIAEGRQAERDVGRSMAQRRLAKEKK